MATDGGISDNAIINETRPRAGVSSGWASLGNALGGGQSQSGGLAYDRGMQIGAQTVDALAQAKDRIQKTQMAHQAANAIRSPTLGQIFHLDPTEQEYLASGTEAGTLTPDDLVKYVTGKQQYTQRAALADPTVNPDVRLGSALALDPAGAVPKAEGPLGTVIAPLSPGYNPNAALSPTNSPVSVGGPQLAQSQSEINERNANASKVPSEIAKTQAETAAAAALATQRQNNPQGGTAGGLKKGYMFQMDPGNPGEVMRDANGIPIQIPNPSAGGEGAVAQRRTNIMVNSANGLAKESVNLSKLGFGTSTEAQTGSSGHGGSITDVIKDNLTKELSSEDSQEYVASMANVDRQLAFLENAGGVPPGSYTAQLKAATTNVPGNTINARLYHAAIIRQIAEQAGETIESGQAAEKQKQAVYAAIDKIQRSIPFTPDEVIDFRREGKPGQTFQQFLDTRQREPIERFGQSTSTQAPVGGPPNATAPVNDPLNILRPR